MEFLKNKKVKFVLWSVLGICVTGLYLGGTKEADFNEMTKLVLAAVASVIILIQFIIDKSDDRKSDKRTANKTAQRGSAR